MNYDEVKRNIHQKFGEKVPEDESIQRNRDAHPEAMQAIKNTIARNREPASAGKCPYCDGTTYTDLGYCETDQGEYHFSGHCKCNKMLEVKRMIEKSGISQIMQEYTFDSFKTDEPFKQEMARICSAFVREYLTSVQYAKKPWLFLGGQPGCGKTHICTAVVNKLLAENVPCLYIGWAEEAKGLKSSVNDAKEYDLKLKKLLDAPVLYIDDLFKSKGKTPPSDADVKAAFDIINGRYIKNMATIISSEWLLDELIQQDEGAFTRLRERANGYTLNIGPDSEKNYRLKGN